MTSERKKELRTQRSRFRNQLIDSLHSIQAGYPGGSLSYIEILTVLYFKIMNVDPQNPAMKRRDHLVLSKGHATPILYLVLAGKGFFPEEELKSLCQVDSMLQEHPCVHKTPGVGLSTGPLRLGLPAGFGMALSARIKGQNSYTYAIMEDGKVQESCVWGAAMSALKFKTDHLIGFLDNSGVQLDGALEKIVPMSDLRAKWEVLGWGVVFCDDHDVEDICRAVKKAETVSGKPSLILAKTVKGKDVSFMGGRNTWHGEAINDEEYARTKTELGGAL